MQGTNEWGCCLAGCIPCTARQGQTARKAELKAPSWLSGRIGSTAVLGKLPALCHIYLHLQQPWLEAQKETAAPNKGWGYFRAQQWDSWNNICWLKELLKSAYDHKHPTREVCFTHKVAPLRKVLLLPSWVTEWKGTQTKTPSWVIHGVSWRLVGFLCGSLFWLLTQTQTVYFLNSGRIQLKTRGLKAFVCCSACTCPSEPRSQSAAA